MCTFEFEPGMIDYRTVVVTVIVLGCVLVAAVAMEVRPGAGLTLADQQMPKVRCAEGLRLEPSEQPATQGTAILKCKGRRRRQVPA